MANLLNFNLNRSLEFSAARALQFNTDRELGFSPARELDFDSDRDLPFGKRGVLFRGYVCASCQAIVSPDATKCDECGAVFEEPGRKGGSPARAASRVTPSMRGTPARVAPTASPVPPVPPPYSPPPPPAQRAPSGPAPATTRAPAASPTASRFCPNCGARSWSGDAFCWNCGARFTASSNVVTASPGAVPARPTEGGDKVQLPARKSKKVVKDWRETGKELSEFLEEK